jgi:Sporulation and spore germination
VSVSRRFIVASFVLVVAVGAIAWGVVSVWWPWGPSAGGGRSGQAAGQQQASRKIKATLFYLDDTGLQLKGVEREVAYGEGSVEQAKRIIEAQIQPAPPPLLSAIPAGTTLRGLFVTDRGEAYVDLSEEIRTGHPGGSLNEILTVYTIVYALTTNLPTITAAQVLVDGHEVDTLAGHVDLRRPLPSTPTWLGGSTGRAAMPAPSPAAPVRSP